MNHDKLLKESLHKLDNMSTEEFEAECIKAVYQPKSKLEDLIQHYVDECHPTNIEGVIKLSERYMHSMDDCQVKVLWYQLIEFAKENKWKM